MILRKEEEFALVQEILERQRLSDEVEQEMRSITPDEVRKKKHIICSLKDQEGRYLAISPAYEYHMGISNDEVLGKKVSDVWEGEIAKSLEKKNLFARKTLRSFHGMQTWLNKRTGRMEEGYIIIHPNKLNGEVGTYSVVPRDQLIDKI